MNYSNITKNDLNHLETDIFYSKYLDKNNYSDIFGDVGKEHYKLLSYFSTLFNNSNILDIGTHTGCSALALSYNSTNTIYSFDIMDKIMPSIKTIKNIHETNEFVHMRKTC